MTAPQLVMLAGPNGAGKSTYYDLYLSAAALPFLNADLFAAETGTDSLDAARILDATRDRMIEDRLGFITETVFSDPHGVKLEMLRAAVAAGYAVTLIYIGADARLLPLRVDQRIQAGGHDVPRDRIETRFERSLVNLAAAIQSVPHVKIYDNSRIDEPYRLIAVFESGELTFRAVGKAPAWARTVIPARRRRR